MSFNDEDLVRSVANSKIPIISAVGHEVDWTLIDYASDLRLPTPTSVAEYLTISKEQAYINLNHLVARLYRVIIKNNIRKTKLIENLFLNFIYCKANKLNKNINNFNYIQLKLKQSFKNIIQKYRNNKILLNNININKIVKNIFQKWYNKINIYSLKIKNFENKYPILKDLDNKIVKLKKDLKNNKIYTLKFPDGEIKIKIIDK